MRELGSLMKVHTAGWSLSRSLPAAFAGLTLASCNPQQTNQNARLPSDAQNEVVSYLQGAERQAESPTQENEIVKALQDLRSLPPAQLKQRRYADYAMVPSQWTLGQLLQKYFVPTQPRAIDEDRLYRDAQDPKARAVIDEHIKAIHEQRQVFKTP
jgi:hypothetical protein